MPTGIATTIGATIGVTVVQLSPPDGDGAPDLGRLAPSTTASNATGIIADTVTRRESAIGGTLRLNRQAPPMTAVRRVAEP